MGYIFKKMFWKIAVTCHKFFRKLSATCFLWDLKFALHTAYYFNLQISLREDHHFKKHCSKTNFLFSLSGVLCLLLAVNYRDKKLHHRCLTGSEICLCILSCIWTKYRYLRAFTSIKNESSDLHCTVDSIILCCK